MRELSDAEKFKAFARVVETTSSALAQGDKRTPEIRRSALQPFVVLDLGASHAESAPSSPPSAPGDCSTPDSAARPTHLVTPDYPPFAYVSVTSGTVNVAVSLSDTGDIRFVRAISNTLNRGNGADAVIQASIFAVAASRYQPAIKNCRFVPGIFMIRAEFRRR